MGILGVQHFAYSIETAGRPYHIVANVHFVMIVFLFAAYLYMLVVLAFIGALYVDQGLESCTAFCQVCFFPRLKVNYMVVYLSTKLTGSSQKCFVCMLASFTRSYVVRS